MENLWTSKPLNKERRKMKKRVEDKRRRNRRC
jgi:hypothetical protein